MDPDTTLEELLSLVDGDRSGLDAEQRAEEMAERIGALDDWLRRRGFLPAAWQAPPPPPDPIRLRCGACDGEMDHFTTDRVEIRVIHHPPETLRSTATEYDYHTAHAPWPFNTVGVPTVDTDHGGFDVFDRAGARILEHWKPGDDE